MGFAAEQSNAKSSHLYLLWRATIAAIQDGHHRFIAAGLASA
jgi:hypothetical protein